MQENWKTYNFSELFDISSGLSKSRDQFGFGHPFVTFKNVFYNFFLPNELGELANTNEKERISGSVLKGDIFLTRTSETLHELGMSSVALKDYPNATFNGFCKRLRIKKDATIQVDPVFIGYFLRSHFFRNEVTKHATMTTRASLNSTAIKTLQVTLPPFKEQRAIGRVLKPLDDKIELNLQTNKTLEEMAMILYKHWFVDFGPFRDGNFVDSELGLIPDGWEVKKLGDLIDLNPRLSLSKGTDASFIEMKALPIDVMSVSDVARKEFSGGSKFQNGDILFARITPCLENGKTAFVDFLKQKEIGFGSTEFLVMRAKREASKYWTYCLARDSKFRKFSVSTMVGTSGRQRVQNDPFLSYEIVKPPTEIFHSFSENVEFWFSQIRLNTIENQTLTALRDSLLPKLISGEVRVRDAEKLLTDAL